jgi:hypothetical protein
MRPSPQPPTLAAPLHRRLPRFYALIPTPLYLPPNLHKYLLCRIKLRRVGRLDIPATAPLSHRLRLGKSRMAPYHALPPCPFPRPEYLLNRLNGCPPPLSPASIAPLAAAPTAPAIL